MDYNEGSRLIKPQWDLIHNPELTTGLLDDESEGAIINLPDGVTVSFTDNNHKKAYANLLMTTDGKAFISRYMKPNGDRANDILSFEPSERFDQNHPEYGGILGSNMTYTKNGVFYANSAKTKQEVLAGFRQIIKLDNGLDEVSATIVLFHEIFVHADRAADILTKITTDINKGRYKSFDHIIAELDRIVNAEKEDHEALKSGGIIKFKRCVYELAKMKNNKKFIKEYEDDKAQPRY